MIMIFRLVKVLCLMMLVIPVVHAQSIKQIWLDELPVKSFSEGIPGILAKTNQGGDSIRMAGKNYTHGIGVASTSIISFCWRARPHRFPLQWEWMIWVSRWFPIFSMYWATEKFCLHQGQ